MHISPTLMLTVGLTAAALFLSVFTIATVITFRNRRVIRKYSSKKI